MEKQFTTYQIAKDLKELGFDEECLAHRYTDNKEDFHLLQYPYNNLILTILNYGVAAPLWQQAIDWLLKEIQNKSNRLTICRYETQINGGISIDYAQINTYFKNKEGFVKFLIKVLKKY